MVALYDLNGNYVGEGPMPSGGSPPQGTKRNRGDVPPAWNSNAEPWGGFVDQMMSQNGLTGRKDIIQDIPAPPVQTASNYSTLDTVTPLDINRLGLTTSPFAKPAERAIVEALIQGGMRAPTGGSNRGRPARRGGGLMFEPVTVAGPAPAGDPWRGLRVDPRATQQPGMVTGNRGGGLMSAPPQERGGGLMGLIANAFAEGGPERTNPNITYDQPRVVVPGTAGEINGVDMAFMPQSVQQSSRWRTGY